MQQNNDNLIDRPAAVAGRFYPDNAVELTSEVRTLFNKAEKLVINPISDDEELLAIISPHAGYVFSGTVAASAFLPLKNRKDIQRVFLIGSSHHASFDSASVYFRGNFITPLGKVIVDRKTAKELISRSSVFNSIPEAHTPEHSLEVQLPFLQLVLEKKFQIIPILIGTQSNQTCSKLAQILKPYMVPGNLFIISTDFSHYPEYYDAVKIDGLTTDSLNKNNPDVFVAQLRENEQKNIKNLATSICGWTSVLTLLYMTTGNPGIHYKPILYQNSGDTPLYGEKSRVVGYQSIAVIKGKSDGRQLDLKFDEAEKEKLLFIARQSVSEYLHDNKQFVLDEKLLPKALLEKYGAFVSIYIKGSLRGCIGRMQSEQPIFKTIQEMAVSAAFHDTRFEPVALQEIDKIDIEISILSPMRKISSIDEIVPGKHGILIKKDFRSGTYLPQVALKTGWDTKELLSRCAEEKAGIGRNGWKDAEIYIYETFVFSDNK